MPMGDPVCANCGFWCPATRGGECQMTAAWKKWLGDETSQQALDRWAEPRFDRAAMVRAVVAQQWAVAVAFWAPHYEDRIGCAGSNGRQVQEVAALLTQRLLTENPSRDMMEVAALPCAVDVVADLLGGAP